MYIYLHVYIHTHTYPHIFIIHSSIIGHLGFHVLAIINNATLNIRVQISLQDNDFVSFRYIC